MKSTNQPPRTFKALERLNWANFYILDETTREKQDELKSIVGGFIKNIAIVFKFINVRGIIIKQIF